jgi:formate dehydrogenase subunit gamma
MSAYDIQPGDAVHRGDPVVVDRYTLPARLNHWVTATCLTLLALSGLSLFHPSLFFLTNLFGGGQWTRTVHPWIGVVMFVSFSALFVRFWRANLWKRVDTAWMARGREVLLGHDENLPEPGKYNAGQKLMFWAMSFAIVFLLGTGLVIWDQYFFAYTSIEVKRIAVLMHALGAIGMICVWIAHIYAAIWVRGSMGAMIGGKVTGGWAWRHHRKWLRELAARPSDGDKKTSARV